MRRDVLRVAVVALLSILAQACAAIEPPSVRAIPPPDKVLFVGNSFIYFNDGLHTHVANLLRAAGRYREGETRLRLAAISGSYLREHKEELEALVTPGAFDVVVMHGYSNEPIDPANGESFRETVKSFASFLRGRGATPVLLMTWAYREHPGMSARLQSAYTSSGNEVKALVVPVGRAFDLVESRYPEIDLYKKDIAGFEGTGESTRVLHKEIVKHPSISGTYLAACVIYAALWGASPVGLAYRSELDSGTASVLQSAAAETISEYYRRSAGGTRD